MTGYEKKVIESCEKCNHHCIDCENALNPDKCSFFFTMKHGDCSPTILENASNELFIRG